MTDPTTMWFVTVQYNNKKVDTIANLSYKKLLSRYPRPTIIINYHGN